MVTPRNCNKQQSCLAVLIAFACVLPHIPSTFATCHTVCDSSQNFDTFVACLSSNLGQGSSDDDVCLLRRLGESYRSVRKMSEAASAWTQAASLFDPGPDAMRYIRRGEDRHNENHLADALEGYGKAISVRPDYARAFRAAGVAWFHMGHRDRALSCFLTAVRLDPSPWVAYYTLTEALRGVGRTEDAIPFARAGIALNPTRLELQCRLLILQRDVCDLRGSVQLFENIVRNYFPPEGEMAGPCVTPFDALSLPLSPVQSMLVTQRYALDHQNRAQKHLSALPMGGLPSTPLGAPVINGLRIAYTSACLDDNKLGLYLLRVLRAHSQMVHPSCFAFNRVKSETGQYWRDQISAACGDDAIIDLSSLGDVDAAVAINSKRPHILLDADSWNDGGRPVVLSLRPAPIQVGLINFAGTGGLHAVNHFIADRVAVPPETADHFTERLVLLPPTYQVFAHTDMAPKLWDGSTDLGMGGRSSLSTTTRKLLGLPLNRKLIFCNSQLARVDVVTVRAWATVLHNNPDTDLWMTLFRADARVNMKRNFVSLGVDANRIHLTKILPLDQHFAARAAADIALDTPTFNGHTAVADVLSVGVPVVTVAGWRMGSRVAASLATSLECTFLVARNIDEYIAMATRLLRSLPNPNNIAATEDVASNGHMGHWRRQVQTNRQASRMFDVAKWTQSFERALASLWDSAVEVSAVGKAPHVVVR